MGLIAEDIYDLIVLYNGDYDYYMHRRTPEGKRALQALDENIDTWCGIYDRIRDCWKGHRTALAFAPDHGCHRILGFLGTHGKEEPCATVAPAAPYLPQTSGIPWERHRRHPGRPGKGALWR